MRRQIKPFTVERKRSGRSVVPAEAPPLDLPPPPPEPEAPKSSDMPRWAAAEALFSTPATKPREQTTTGEAPASGGRILPSLIEPPAPAPTPSYEVDDEPKRRGRKPGSRNRSPRAGGAEQGPKTIENVMRNLFEFWAQEDDRADEIETAPASTPVASTPVASTSAASRPDVATPINLRRRGRVLREDLPRAQRWKARLPRFAR